MSKLRPKPKRIAAKVLAIRPHLGLSQMQLKRRINFPGDYGRISDYGKRAPTILTLLAYARAAKIPLKQIVCDELELEF